MTDDNMSKAERDELLRLLKARARVAKAGVDHRRADLLADIEAQLAAQYKFGDDAWADVTRVAEEAVAEADARVAEACGKLGIPERFRPGLQLSWYSRGENAAATRRSELRKAAVTRLDAAGRKAKYDIESASLDLQTRLVSGALESGAAREFLASLPTPEALMPPLAVPELEAGRADER